jgi:hypothetical protein
MDKNTYIVDDQRMPLVLHHGTPVDFECFDLNKHHSVGVHFGCIAQANARLTNPGIKEGWIISAHILLGRPYDIEFPIDSFHENPAVTAHYLKEMGALDDDDMIALGFANISSSWAAMIDWPGDTRRVKNAAIRERLLVRYDTIIYSNRQEPNDGVARTAYCILSTEQIHKIGKEKFKPAIT